MPATALPIDQRHPEAPLGSAAAAPQETAA
jgi:hypothetical protein